MRHVNSIYRGVLLILLACLAWRSLNYVSGNEPGPDSSIFLSMAWHADAGRVLYKDVWDHKPPLIFALNGLALALGDRNVNSVRNMERVFAIVGVTAFFGAVYLGFRSFWLGYLTSILYLFHFYWRYVFEDGNVTEEYGAVFSTVAVVAAVASVRSSGRRSPLLSGLAGVAFSAAILCKEPFLLMVPPWFLYVAWAHGGNWKDARSRAVAFLCGAVIPGLIFVEYLLLNGAWADWMDVIAFNLSNKAGAIPRGSETFVGRMLGMADAKVFGTLITTRVTALLGLAGVLRWSLGRRTHGLPLAIAASAVLSLLATSLGDGYSGHYYMFFVPSYLLLGASGIAFVADLVPPNRRVLALAPFVVLLWLDSAALKAFAGRLAEPSRRWQGHPLSEMLRKNTSPGDLMWAPWTPLLNVETDRLSPTKWFFAFDHLFVDTPASTAVQKFQALHDDLQRHPPRVIVLNAPPGLRLTRATADAFLARSGLKDWIAANYWTALGSGSDRFQVVVSNGSLALSAAELHESPPNAMKTGLDALYRENDPFKAIFQFHRVLDETPTHYAANYQLATALDAAGQLTEARRTWARVYALATKDDRDAPSMDVVRRRLATADAETPDGWMAAGLDCLYALNDGAAATQNFRKVLAENPAHYGANLQLAKSLDVEKKVEEAKTQWGIVLRLAEAAADTATATAARTRLQQPR